MAAEKGAGPRAGRVFYGWWILATFWLLLAVNLGFPVYGAGVINTAMAEALHFNAKMLGLTFSVFMLMLGLPAPLIAIMINRFGLRPVLIVGTLLIAIGAVAMATVVHGPIAAALIFGGVIGAGVAAGGNLVTQVGIGRWFVRRRSLAFALMFTANGIGGLIAAPLLDWIIERNGDWRSGWLLIGSLSLVAGLCAVLVVRESPEAIGQLPDGGRLDTAADSRRKIHISCVDFTVREAARTTSLWIAIAVIMVNFMGLSLILSHGVANLRSLGHSPSQAALVLSAMSAGTLIGKIGLGFLGDHIEPRLPWSLATFLGALGLAVAPFATTPELVLLHSMLFGIGFGGSLVLQSALLMNFFGVRHFASLLSIALISQTALSTLTPFLAGWVKDQSGTYLPVFLVAAAISVAAAIGLLFIRAPRLQPAA